MIGHLERVCDQARADARCGERARFDSMSSTLWKAYIHAWQHERRRMAASGKLPQLDLFRGQNVIDEAMATE